MHLNWMNLRQSICAFVLGAALCACSSPDTTLKGSVDASSNVEPGAEEPMGELPEPPPIDDNFIFALDTLTRDMTTVNSNRWSPSFRPGFGRDDDSLGPGHYAYVNVGIRLSDGNSWEQKYLNRDFALQNNTMIRVAAQFHLNDALQARNNAPNTRVQVRDCNLLTLRSNGQWVVQNNFLNDAKKAFGKWYGATSLLGAPAVAPIAIGNDAPWKKRDESFSGGGSSYGWIGYGKMGSAIPSNPFFYDGWSIQLDETGLFDEKSLSQLINDVVGHVTYCQARLILHDPIGPDDRAQAHIIMNASAHYYNLSRGGQHISEAFHGRFKAITNDWQPVTATDLSEDQLARFPPPKFVQ